MQKFFVSSLTKAYLNPKTSDVIYFTTNGIRDRPTIQNTNTIAINNIIGFW